MSSLRESELGDDALAHKMAAHTLRIEGCLNAALPEATQVPTKLHEAMRYAVLNGGKRIRPLLVYASGECLGLSMRQLDVPATAIELMHAFSLVHDDLPAMDNDDLRRGQPTVHRRFDEATAILAADALQPLAFETIARSEEIDAGQARRLASLIAQACGSLGMTGGQSIDLDAEGQDLTATELTEMHSLKTGALIRASAMSPCCLADNLSTSHWSAMDRFSQDIGLAFQIRDDILDVTGQTDVIGKPTGSDQNKNKATWPSVFGMEESIRRCDELLDSAMQALSVFGAGAQPLRLLANFVVARVR